MLTKVTKLVCDQYPLTQQLQAQIYNHVITKKYESRLYIGSSMITTSGDIVLNDASVKVIYLGTTYSMDNVKLNFNNRKINIEDFYITDERNGNYTALVKGYITHKNFNDIQLNLNVSSDNFLCLIVL